MLYSMKNTSPVKNTDPKNLDMKNTSPVKNTDPKNLDMEKLKLFVWTDFSPDYTSGLAFAIAKDEASAKREVRKVYPWMADDRLDGWDLTVHPMTRPISFAVSGGG